MSNVFAFHDLLDVLAAFPPPAPEQQPSVVVAGDKLKQTRQIQVEVDKLLQKGRVELAALAKTVGVKDVEWALQRCLYSSERTAVLSQPEIDRVLSLIKQDTQNFILLKAFASEHDVDLDSLRSLLEDDSSLEVLQDPTSKSQRRWVCSKDLLRSTIAKVESLLKDASDQKVDLSANLTGVPRFLVVQLAEELAASQDSLAGTVKNGKLRVTYLSIAYEKRVADERAKKIAKQFAKILVETHRTGYHRVPEEDEENKGLRKVFFERTKGGVDDGSFSLIKQGDTPIALAFTNKLEALLTELKTKACDGVEEGKGELSPALIETLSQQSEFAALILQDERHRATVESAMQAKAAGIEADSMQKSLALFNEHVRIPTQLYLTGVNQVQGDLRRRLDDFLFEYLRKDLIPSNMPQDKRALKSFQDACTDARNLADIQTALQKISRKHKLEVPVSARMNILQQKAKSLKKMIRASDILQNLVWILLAQELDGMFISSGRDTTRMIKFYQGLGEHVSANAGRLLAWKDRFKEGQETRADIEEMRAMAEDVLARMDQSIGQKQS